MLHPARSILTVVVAILVSAAAALAQPGPGKLSGTVRDPNGAPVVGATVTVTNQQTGAVARITRTNPSGAYEFSDVAPGSYTVAADMPGFRRVTKVVDYSGAGLAVDLALEVRISEAVTVTAMKREETILNTPVSVAAPTEETLRERGAETLEDVAANVAGFSVQNLGPGQNQVSIRGVSSGQIARDQPGVKESVGSYLDESVISLSLFTPDIDLFDVGRVEVLRGPQGTLFGSGSESGTVRYITNQPEVGISRFFGEVGGELNGRGGDGGYAKAGINAPLGDKTAVRLVGYYDRMPGWTDALQPDFTFKRNVNTTQRTGFRGALAIAPDPNLTITPRIVYQDVRADGWNREDIYNILANPFTTTRPPATLKARQIFTQIDEPYTDNFLLGDLNIKYNLGAGLQLTSITSYTRRNILVVRDAGALTSSITGGSIGLPEKIYTLLAPLNDNTHARAVTEEARLSGGNDRLKWVGGVFYADQHRDYAQRLVVSGFDAASGIPTQGVFAPKDNLFWSDLHYQLKQFAVFGEGTFNFTNQLSATGGLRYYHYKEDKQQVFDGLFGSDANGNPQSQPGTIKADGVAPRVIVSYKLNEATTFNAQASKGFRLGGVNDPLNVNLCTPSDLVTFGGRDAWKDEVSWNYEVGSKSSILGGRGSFSASAFYVDIKDLQVTVTAGSCSSRLIFNVPKARSYGGEVEFTAAPNDHLDFALSLGLNKATLQSTVTSTDAAGNVTVVSGIQSGARLPSVPQAQWALAGTYQTPVAPQFQGYVTTTYTHIGPRFTQVGDNLLGVLDLTSFGKNALGGPLTAKTFVYDAELAAYDLINLRLGVRHGNWDTAFYVNNLTDENAHLALDRERGTRARIGYLTNPPRTYGISTRVDF